MPSTINLQKNYKIQKNKIKKRNFITTMEQAIKNDLPRLLDEATFQNQSFSEVVRTWNTNLKNLPITEKSYGVFKTNTDSVLGCDSMLQRCHSLATGTHNIDPLKINITIKSRLAKGTPKYENQRIARFKKLGHLVTKTLGEDNLKLGSVKRGAFGKLQFGIFSIPVEYLMRIFPFENSSFFIDLGEDSIDISEYLDENSRLLKSIIALSKYYDYTFQLSCNQATANSFDEATLFSFHLKHSTEAVNKLKTFSQDFESFGRGRKQYTIEQIYQFLHKIFKFPILVCHDFVSHLILNTCLNDTHPAETYEDLMERESWRLTCYKQIQSSTPKVLSTLRTNLLRLLERNQLSATSKNYPQFNLVSTQLRISRAEDMKNLSNAIKERNKTLSNTTMETSENDSDQKLVENPQKSSDKVESLADKNKDDDDDEGQGDPMIKLAEMKEKVDSAVAELNTEIKRDDIEKLDRATICTYYEERQNSARAALERVQELNVSVVHELTDTHHETGSNVSADTEKLCTMADQLKHRGNPLLDECGSPAQAPPRPELLIQPNLEGPGGSSQDRTARNLSINRSLNVSNKHIEVQNINTPISNKSVTTDTQTPSSNLDKIKVDNSKLNATSANEDSFHSAVNCSDMLYRTAQDTFMSSEPDESSSSQIDEEDDEEIRRRDLSNSATYHTSTPFSLRKPKLQFGKTEKTSEIPSPVRPISESTAQKKDCSEDKIPSERVNADLNHVQRTVYHLANASADNSHAFSKFMVEAEEDVFTDKIMRNIKKNLNPAPPVRNPRRDSGLGKSVHSEKSDTTIFPLFPPIDEASFNKKVKAATAMNKQALAARSDNQEADKKMRSFLRNEAKSYNDKEKQLQRGRDELEQMESNSNFVSIEITSYYNDFETDESSSDSDSSYYPTSDDDYGEYPPRENSDNDLESLREQCNNLKINDPRLSSLHAPYYKYCDSNSIRVELDSDEDTTLTMDQVSDILGYYELQKSIVQQLEREVQKLKDMMSRAQSGNDPAFSKAVDYNKLYGVYLSVQQQRDESVKLMNTQKKVLEKCMKSIDSQQQNQMKETAKTEKQSEIASVLTGFRETVQDLVKDIFSPKLVDQITPVKFSGHINDFENFWNLFDVAVHSNTRYKNRPKDKLVQLKSCVQHLRACNEITEMKIEDYNYAEAVSILKRIYNNPEERLKFTNNRLSNKLYAIQNSKDNINIYDYFGLDYIIKAFTRYLEDVMLCIDQRLHHGVAHVEKVAKKFPTKELLKWQEYYESVQSKRHEKAPITVMVKGELIEKPVATNDIADQQLITHFVYFLNELKQVARKYHAARGNSVDSPHFATQKNFIKIKNNNCTVSCNLADPKVIERIDKLNHIDVNQRPELFINAIQAKSTKRPASSQNGNSSGDKPPPFKKFKNRARKNSNRRKKTARAKDFNYSVNNAQSNSQTNNSQARSRSRSKGRNTFPSSNAAIQRRIAKTSKANASRNGSSNPKPILKDPNKPRSRSQSKVRFQGGNRSRSASKSNNRSEYVKTGPTNGNVSKLPSQKVTPNNHVGGSAKHASAIVNSQSNNNQQNKSNNKQAKNKTVFPKGTVICLFCNTKGDHVTAYCTNKSMSPQQRQQIAMQHKLCLNCLFNGHRAAECRKRPCEVSGCSLKHHKLLHDENVRYSKKSNAPSNKSKQLKASSNAVNLQVHPSLEKPKVQTNNNPNRNNQQ